MSNHFYYNNILRAKNSSPVYSENWKNIKNTSKKALDTNPDDIMANFQYSISLANLGKIEEAYNHFELIKDEIELDSFNRTLRPYIKKLEQNPEDILLLNYAAFAATINNDYQKSAEHFENIIEIESKNVWIMNYLAATYLELEKYEKAISILNKATDIKDNKYSHLLLGMVYYKQGRIIRALLEMGKSGDLVNKFILN